MTLTTISIIAATAIYLAYNAICLALFSIPESLSNTYYLWREKSRKGWLFPLMMYLVVALMMPAWISLSEGSNFQFLAFLAPASIAFVGTAPRFKDGDLENKVHTVSAIIAAVCSILWVALVTPYWVAIPIYAVFEGAKAFFSKTYKTAYVYRLEQVAFGSTFTAAIMYSL
jgi:succinate dehydrogenase hydrophobic anchor subunit